MGVSGRIPPALEIGHSASHFPQPTQIEGSAFGYRNPFLSASMEIALTGHALAQAPQPLHWAGSVIVIIVYPFPACASLRTAALTAPFSSSFIPKNHMDRA